MSPAVKQRLSKVLSNSNPNLGPALDRSSKPASGSAMLHAGDVYQRKQILDNADDIDSARRKRSNSADSSTSRVEPEPEPDVASPCKCVGQITQAAQLGEFIFNTRKRVVIHMFINFSSSFIKCAM